jgi:cyclopropane fatty-acyl-phospholipid synthase-like methyltransferase
MKPLTHLGGSHYTGDLNTWMPDIWGFLVFNYNINSVIDIGCGVGLNVQWFQSMGLEIMGIDGDPTAIEKSVIKDNLIIHDFTEKKIILNRNFDLAISTEFVEHVDQQYEEHWMSVLDNCKYFLMSHAVPGQKGHHHVNCQESNYWISRIASKNFKYNNEISQKFRNSINRYPTTWGRNTLLFFEKNDAT